MVAAGRDVLAEPALFIVPDVGLVTFPEGLLPAIMFSLTEGFVLTTVDLEAAVPLVAVPLVAEVALSGVTRVGVSLPDAFCTLDVLLPDTVLFLLTVLRLPMPPLSDEPLPNTLSDPVWCLDPYHTSLSCPGPPIWPGPW